MFQAGVAPTRLVPLLLSTAVGLAPLASPSVADTLTGTVLLPSGEPAAGAARQGTSDAGRLVQAAAVGCQPGWLPTFAGPLGVNGRVEAALVYDDGSGPVLVVGGAFTSAGGLAVGGIAAWDGVAWSSLGGGVAGTWEPRVLALAVFDDGSGPALYAGGSFYWAGGVLADSIARWDGTAWSAVGGTGGFVGALTVFDDGGGPALYAGGGFLSIGGVFVSHVAKWDGTTWSKLAGGTNDLVNALAVFDDGGGPALYAGGIFTAPGSKIAKWNGQSWSPVGAALFTVGFESFVGSITVFDDGGGADLYAGGHFKPAGSAHPAGIAKWNGTSWSFVGGGMTAPGGHATVESMASFDDGSGPALYAGGHFDSIGGVLAQDIARWNGTSWSSMGSGMSGAYFGDVVMALAVFDDGAGEALFAGGSFTTSSAGAIYLAKWGCPAITSQPGCAGNVATLEALASSAPLGAALPLRITGSAAASGLGQVYFGQPGLDAGGCGLLVPGIGELLLALAPTPKLAAGGVLAGGVCDVAPPVPSTPALSGVTAHLQGLALDLALASPIEPTNALAVLLGP